MCSNSEASRTIALSEVHPTTYSIPPRASLRRLSAAMEAINSYGVKTKHNGYSKYYRGHSRAQGFATVTLSRVIRQYNLSPQPNFYSSTSVATVYRILDIKGSTLLEAGLG